MISFTSTKLYSGRALADLPQDFINARLDRPCPEHQEFYYHPDNGISIMIEIEGRFEGTESSAGTSSNSAQSPDLQAVDFHLRSLTEDEGPYTILTPARRVRMGKLDAPAYRLHARIELANDLDADDGGEERAVTSCHMFLARFWEQQADLIVWVNVPGVVVGNASVAEVTDERDDIAACILDRLCESFEIGESGRWKVVDQGTLTRISTGISMTVDQKMDGDNDGENENEGQKVLLSVDDSKGEFTSPGDVPLNLASATYKGNVFDLVDKVLNECMIPICLDDDSSVWGELNWGKLELVFFLSKAPEYIYRSKNDQCVFEWRSICEDVVKHGTGHICFHDGLIEGTFRDLIAGSEGQAHECHFLGDVDPNIAPKDVEDIRKKWRFLEKTG